MPFTLSSVLSNWLTKLPSMRTWDHRCYYHSLSMIKFLDVSIKGKSFLGKEITSSPESKYKHANPQSGLLKLVTGVNIKLPSLDPTSNSGLIEVPLLTLLASAMKCLPLPQHWVAMEAGRIVRNVIWKKKKRKRKKCIAIQRF